MGQVKKKAKKTTFDQNELKSNNIPPMNSLKHLPSLLLLWLSATPPPTMDGTTNSGEPRSSSVLQNTGASEDPNRSGSGQNSMARYKLMSPAKLPISRSPCITIPPGLSPTSFLESPVLLSNMKVSVWVSVLFCFFGDSNWSVLVSLKNENIMLSVCEGEFSFFKGFCVFWEEMD